MELSSYAKEALKEARETPESEYIDLILTKDDLEYLDQAEKDLKEGKTKRL